ncbi:MAG: EF-hand domain-containing protein [Planctomycetaceae bacterium]|nr:EF-hand domain-containing protein [Planctomycetaceae bacterium]
MTNVAFLAICVLANGVGFPGAMDFAEGKEKPRPVTNDGLLEKLHKAADISGDGKINPRDFPQLDNFIPKRYADIDSNHDEEVTLEEYKTGTIKGWKTDFEALDTDGDGSLTKNDTPPAYESAASEGGTDSSNGFASWVQSMDPNKDGKVTFEEYTGISLQQAVELLDWDSAEEAASLEALVNGTMSEATNENPEFSKWKSKELPPDDPDARKELEAAIKDVYAPFKSGVERFSAKLDIDSQAIIYLGQSQFEHIEAFKFRVLWDPSKGVTLKAADYVTADAILDAPSKLFIKETFCGGIASQFEKLLPLLMANPLGVDLANCICVYEQKDTDGNKIRVLKRNDAGKIDSIIVRLEQGSVFKVINPKTTSRFTYGTEIGSSAKHVATVSIAESWIPDADSERLPAKNVVEIAFGDSKKIGGVFIPFEIFVNQTTQARTANITCRLTELLINDDVPRDGTEAGKEEAAPPKASDGAEGK